jgi:hypothetical protein
MVVKEEQVLLRAMVATAVRRLVALVAALPVLPRLVLQVQVLVEMATVVEPVRVAGQLPVRLTQTPNPVAVVTQAM